MIPKYQDILNNIKNHIQRLQTVVIYHYRDILSEDQYGLFLNNLYELERKVESITEGSVEFTDMDLLNIFAEINTSILNLLKVITDFKKEEQQNKEQQNAEKQH